MSRVHAPDRPSSLFSKLPPCRACSLAGQFLARLTNGREVSYKEDRASHGLDYKHRVGPVRTPPTASSITTSESVGAHSTRSTNSSAAVSPPVAAHADGSGGRCTPDARI